MLGISKEGSVLEVKIPRTRSRRSSSNEDSNPGSLSRRSSSSEDSTQPIVIVSQLKNSTDVSSPQKMGRRRKVSGDARSAPPARSKRKSSSDEAADATQQNNNATQPKRKKGSSSFDFESLIKAQTLEASKPSLSDELDSASHSFADGQLDAFHANILKRMTVKTESALKFPPLGYELFEADRYHCVCDAESAGEDPIFRQLSVAFGSSFSGIRCCGNSSASSKLDSLFEGVNEEREKEAILLLSLTIPQLRTDYAVKGFSAFDDFFSSSVLAYMARRKTGLLSPQAFALALLNLGLLRPQSHLTEVFQKAEDWNFRPNLTSMKDALSLSQENLSDTRGVKPDRGSAPNKDCISSCLRSLLQALRNSFQQSTPIPLETAKPYAGLLYYLLWDEFISDQVRMLIHDSFSQTLMTIREIAKSEDQLKQSLCELACDLWSTTEFFIKPLPKGHSAEMQLRHDARRKRGVVSHLHKLHDILHLFCSSPEIPLRRHLALKGLVFISSASGKPINVKTDSFESTSPALLVQAARFLHHLTTTGIPFLKGGGEVGAEEAKALHDEHKPISADVAVPAKNGVDHYLLDVA